MRLLLDAPAEALRERAEELREEAHRSDVRSTRLGVQRGRRSRGMNVVDKECMAQSAARRVKGSGAGLERQRRIWMLSIGMRYSRVMHSHEGVRSIQMLW